MRLSSDAFYKIRELVAQHGATLDLAMIARATNLPESDLRSRFGSLEALLVAALGPTPSAPPPLAPPERSPFETTGEARAFPQLREMFARLTPATDDEAPASEPEITRLTS